MLNTCYLKILSLNVLKKIKKLITIVNKIEKKDKTLINIKYQLQKKINENFKFNIQLDRFKSLWKIHSNLKKYYLSFKFRGWRRRKSNDFFS